MLAFEQKQAPTSVHVIIHKCLILVFKRYGVNKHNLLTTSYFFDESGCEYSWINRKSRVLKLLLFLWSIISTVVILI